MKKFLFFSALVMSMLAVSFGVSAQELDARYTDGDKVNHQYKVDTVRVIRYDTTYVTRVERDTVSKSALPPCYELDELSRMVDEGQSIIGKTLCAVSNILFDFDKDNIRVDSYGYLNKLSNLIKRTGCNVIVAGHTDNKGTAEYNQKLSKRRATSALEYLVAQGVERSKLKEEHYGFDKPRDTNATDAGRQNNRRVEFTFTNGMVDIKNNQAGPKK